MCAPVNKLVHFICDFSKNFNLKYRFHKFEYHATYLQMLNSKLTRSPLRLETDSYAKNLFI